MFAAQFNEIYFSPSRLFYIFIESGADIDEMLHFHRSAYEKAGKPYQGFIQQFREKAPGQNLETMIDLMSKLGKFLTQNIIGSKNLL